MRRRVLGLITAVLMIVVVAAPAFAGGGETSTLDWQGHGSENATVECQEGESHWHWILTPGGNNDLISATLTVNYTSGTTDSVDGEFRGQGSGAMHFDLFRPGSDEVESASVEFTFEGKGGNFVLTISNSDCQKSEEPEPTTTTLPSQENLECPGTLEIGQTVIRDESGTEHVLITADVADEAQGLEATITAKAHNNSSVHPGNDLIVASGSGNVVLADVERAPGVETVADGKLVLGATLTVTLTMGEDGVFSGGMMLSVDCPEERELIETSVSISGECRLVDGEPQGFIDAEVGEGAILSIDGDPFITGTYDDLTVVAPGTYPWIAEAAEGYELVGDTSGEVVIEDCSETTTTTVPEETTTTVPEETTTTEQETTTTTTETDATSTTEAPAPDGDAGNPIPWAVLAGVAMLLASPIVLFLLSWKGRATE